MFLKHLIAIPIIVIVCLVLGWFGRPFVESRLSIVEIPGSANVYQGFDFSFEYPTTYTASEIGLWGADRYQISLNPPKNSTVSNLPDIELVNKSFAGSAQEFLEQEFSTDVSKWPESQDGLEFEQMEVDGEAVWKMRMAEHFDVTEYIKQNGTRFVGFKTYFQDESGTQEAEILELLESLKFE